VYQRAPLLVYWEVTRACDLACRHCRADAASAPWPGELSHAEGLGLLAQIRRFGDPAPHVVLTGGDPLKRPDLFALIGAARVLGLEVSLAPSATPLLTAAAIRRLVGAGITSISLSLDGSDAARHDRLRGVRGVFDATLAAAASAGAFGLPLQVNTLVTADTVDDLPAIADVLRQLRVVRWSVFFLIAVGRGALLRQLTPARAERLLHWLYELSGEAPFAIKTTEAMHYRRVAVRRMRRAGLDEAAIARSPVGRGFGIRDGNGIVFVNHDGEVYPSGFLPLSAGNVRDTPLVELYRDAPLFRQLRDVRGFGGRCGRCDFAPICGGSRARAYAAGGDPLASDPLCPYVPPATGSDPAHT
jgi:AdoMet-dependent heme synthase